MSDPFGRKSTCNAETCTDMSELCQIKFGALDPTLNYSISTSPDGLVELVPEASSSAKFTNNGDGTGTISTTGGDIDFVTAPVDYCEAFNACFTAPVNGPLSDAENWQEAANLTSECLLDVKARVKALEDVNHIVSIDDVPGTNDIQVTFEDGSTQIVDKPEYSAATNPAGETTFTFNGVDYGPFASGPHTIDTDTDTFTTWAVNPDGTVTATATDGTQHTLAVGAHTVDTDTFSSSVDNGDGTVTVTYANGFVATYATGPHTVDTNTTYTPTWAADGQLTFTGSDGSVFVGPAGTVSTPHPEYAAGNDIQITGAGTDADPFLISVVPATIPTAAACVLPDTVIGMLGGNETQFPYAGISEAQTNYERLTNGVVSISGSNVGAAIGTVIDSQSMTITNNHPCKTLRQSVVFGTFTRIRIPAGVNNDLTILHMNTSTPGAGSWSIVDGRSIQKVRSTGNGWVDIGQGHEYTYITDEIAPGQSVTVGFDSQLALGSGSYQDNNFNLVQVGASVMLRGIGVYSDIIPE